MEPGLEYVFGTGDGHPSSWATAPDADVDGDGHDDAVKLDFDGDGRRDDAMWDVDGDGVADVSALDTDDDGRFDHFFRDDGSGVWGIRMPPPTDKPTDSPPPSPPAGRLPGSGPSDAMSAPLPSPESVAPTDPTIRASYDTDSDGEPDIELTGSRRAGIPVAGRLYVDENSDGTFDRVLVDSNGDGAADLTYDARSPQFDRR